MVKIETDTTHPLHPIHPLAPCNNGYPYFCDGCKLPGSGGRYRCNACDFDLHLFCTSLTPQVSSGLHPQHLLLLVLDRAAPVGQLFCDGCRQMVAGMYYTCGTCNFDLHPSCVSIQPQPLLQPQTLLQLQPQPQPLLQPLLQPQPQPQPLLQVQVGQPSQNAPKRGTGKAIGKMLGNLAVEVAVSSFLG